MKTKKIKAPKGYRKLRKGTLLIKTDCVAEHITGKLRRTSRFGERVGDSIYTSCTYYRPINKKGQTK